MRADRSVRHPVAVFHHAPRSERHLGRATLHRVKTTSPESKPRLRSLIHLLGRLGADVRVFHNTDTDPPIWTLRATLGRTHFHGVGEHELAAALDLAADILDGHACPTCFRTTALSTEATEDYDVLTAFTNYCWITYDRDSNLVRDCGGSVP